MKNDLILELLTVSRMYANLPFNAIHEFVALPEKRNKKFFMDNIHVRMYNVCSPKVDSLLDEIRSELVFD